MYSHLVSTYASNKIVSGGGYMWKTKNKSCYVINLLANKLYMNKKINLGNNHILIID